MSVINTNYLSLVAQNNLQKSQSALGSAIERLSSGLRINSAKDDAAGQAIANRMTSQVKGLNQAQRNANDGISVAQTAEGALNQVNDNLQRIRELTVQAQNSTNSVDDKNSIQAEINQRLSEIDRISEETNFNGVKVLSEDRTLNMQVGANDGEVIGVGLKEINRQTLGLEGFSISAKALNVSEEITQTNFGGTPADVSFSNITAAQLSSMGVSSAEDLSLHNVQTSAGAATGSFVVKAGDSYYAASVDNATGAVRLNTVDVPFTDPDNGVSTAVSLTSQLVKVGVDASGAATAYVTIQGKNFTDAGIDTEALVNGGGTATAGTSGAINLSGTSATTEFVGASTNNPLEKLDEALKKVDILRSDLGAIQNRFESAITNLQTNSTNLQAARSRIEDADYAVEVANMSKNQILQQAGTSVLAQANQIPQGVLSLLR